jgi:hypothetical protein
MRLEHVPQGRFVVNSLINMMAACEDDPGETRSYNSAVGCGVDELVKQNMRHLSQRRGEVRGGDNLLEAALRQTTDQLQKALDSHSLTFDLAPYLEHASESLGAVANELSDLSNKLIESKAQKRVGEKMPIAGADDHGLYEVLELGLLESIEGLLVTPTVDVASLNVDSIRQAFPTKGEWFPFEVTVDDFIFVIDDDGALFISTENFPREVLDRARNVLQRLAGILYL